MANQAARALTSPWPVPNYSHQVIEMKARHCKSHGTEVVGSMLGLLAVRAVTLAMQRSYQDEALQQRTLALRAHRGLSGSSQRRRHTPYSNHCRVSSKTTRAFPSTGPALSHMAAKDNQKPCPPI